ncbi:MAG: hypothetical protein ACRD3N_14465 [Terracidiphilus sp.]
MSHAVRKLLFLPALAALCCAAYGSTPNSGPLTVCEIISHPMGYVGKTVAVEGEVLFVPPHVPLQLVGKCIGGVYVILPDKHEKFVNDARFREFVQDIWKYRKNQMAARLNGTVKIEKTPAGDRQPLLYLKSVVSIQVLREFSFLEQMSPFLDNSAGGPLMDFRT